MKALKSAMPDTEKKLAEYLTASMEEDLTNACEFYVIGADKDSDKDKTKK